MDLTRENARLRKELEIRDAEIAELRALVADEEIAFPPEWRLTHIQARMLRFLLNRKFATREQLHSFLYGEQADGGPSLTNIRVHVCLLRKRVKPFGLSLRWSADGGYFLDDRSKGLIRSQAPGACA